VNTFARTLSEIFDNGAEAPIADPAEERALIADAKRGDEAATVALLLAYAPALRKAVGRYRYAGGLWQDGPTHPSTADDLRSGAVVGLLDAVKAFDPEKHRRLAAIIGGYVADALQVAAPGPVGLHVPRRTLTRFYTVLRRAEGDVVAAAALAPEEGMTVGTFMDALAAVRTADLPLPSGDDEADEAARLLWENARPVWSGEHADASDRVLVETAFAAVDELEEEVCRLSYGFETYGEPLADAEVGFRLGLSRPKAQRVRSSALGKMREALAVA